ncbi:MAG: alpha/beta fold hydrolase [Gammaproteobacteria bacterium]|nr:alpha/beta fold hydrolase [Gammaproteobacteria bacterium]
MNSFKSPSFLAVARESLSGFEFARLAAAVPVLRRQPKGNGEPVMVLPGYAASDRSTVPLRAYLSWLGYDTCGWDLGRNTGNVRELLPRVANRVRLIGQQKGSVNLIGWSLGGVIAREVAREIPAMVRQVVTMGSPVVGGPKYTSLGSAFAGQGVDLDAIEARIAARESRPIRVPVTSIYSKRDGIVSWQASIDRHNPQVDHIEVGATHLGLGISPDVFRIIAAKLVNPVPARKRENQL